MYRIITNCSSTRMITPVARVQDLPEGLTNQEAVDKWVAILKANKASTTPREQYRGQGFLTLLKTITDHKPISVNIITGGLGFTGIDEPIVPYDFSGSPKEEHNITTKVTKEPFSLPVWWSLINKARKIHPQGNPVAAFIEGMLPDERCIISCSKLFLKYIAQDFLSASEEAKRKCKILLTASSIGSVPMQLRPYIVSFERSAVQHIPGNRNDINHRAMQEFMSKVKTTEQFDQPSYIISNEVFGSASGDSTHAAQIDVLTTLQNRPELLKLDPETAYKTIYREVGPFGGRQTFKGFFIRAQMDAGIIKSTEAAVDDDALDALGGLSLKVAAKPIEEDALQDQLDFARIFIGAVRKTNPGAEFTAADVGNWARAYSAKKGFDLDPLFTNITQLAYFLKSYSDALGLTKLDKTFTIQLETING